MGGYSRVLVVADDAGTGVVLEAPLAELEGVLVEVDEVQGPRQFLEPLRVPARTGTDLKNGREVHPPDQGPDRILPLILDRTLRLVEPVLPQLWLGAGLQIPSGRRAGEVLLSSGIHVSSPF